MKWFKHLVASGDDPDIHDAMTLYGSDGYYVFFRTLEVMSREFDINSPGTCTFSISFFRKKFPLSWQKISRVLAFFDERGRIKIEYIDKNKLPSIRINCPKLKGLCDEYTQKLLAQNTRQYPDNDQTETGGVSGQSPEQEEEEEGEEEYIDTSSSDELPEIEAQAQVLYDAGMFPEVYTFINKAKKENKHPESILQALNQYYLKGYPKYEPWPYCQKIVNVESGNFYERDNTKNHEELKKIEIDDINNIMQNFGKMPE